tara:strand:+ start:606 stop:1235 length:630 start_codon:yes stop_codon:yes gene_type:complete
MSDYSRNNNTPSSGPASSPENSRGSRNKQEPEKRKTVLLKSNGFVDPVRNNQRAVVIDAIEDLKSESLVIDFSMIKDMEFLSTAALSGVGFTMVKTEELTTSGGSLKDFSLINTKNDETSILNSKIVDPNIGSITPEVVDTKEKFKSETDNFYQLDDERPIKIKEENRFVKKSIETRKKALVAQKIIPSVRRSKNIHLPKRSRVRRRRK